MDNPKRVLAIASGGGHWAELLRLRPAWDGCDVTYATTSADYRDAVVTDAQLRGQKVPNFNVVTEANRREKLKLLRCLFEIAMVVIRTRPDVVVTTGAAPGFFALRIAGLTGARTIWVDSIANAQELSLSGQKAGSHADLWLTQWPDLARPNGPHYRGAVL